MQAIDFRAVRGVGRDCPHPGCGVTFEVTLADLPLRDPGREYRCAHCQSIIPWPELQTIRELLEDFQQLRQGAVHYRVLYDAAPRPR